MPTSLSPLEKLSVYLTGTYKLPKTVMLHVGPPLDWKDAAKLASHLASSSHANPRELPNTKGLSEATVFDVYAGYVRAHGSQAAQDALENGDQVIVGLRISTNTRANGGHGVYDDRIAIIWREEAKPMPATLTQSRVKPALVPVNFSVAAPTAPKVWIKRGVDFTANTEPSAQYEDPGHETKQIVSKKTGKLITVNVVSKIIGPDGKAIHFRKAEGDDVNKDGRKDLGRLVPGTYDFYRSFSKPLKSFVLRGTNDQRVQRDINHDGEFTAADIWHTDSGDAVVETGNFAILIHPGSKANTDSAGCQTIPRIQFAKFVRALKRTQSHYLYVLVTLR